jgi:DNA relaxase NicK
MIACIDWLTFTKKLSLLDDELESVEKMKNYILPNSSNIIESWKLERGRFGYTKMWTLEGIEIMFEGNNSICVNMTGKGCRTFEIIHNSFDGLILEIVRNKYKVTRLDLAVDDKEKALDIKRIFNMSEIPIVNGELNNKCKCWGEFRTVNRIMGTQGTTIYYGSNESEKRIKIYDKAMEQKLTNQHWIRVELTLRNNSAFMALDLMNTGIPAGKVFAGAVRKYLFI